MDSARAESYADRVIAETFRTLNHGFDPDQAAEAAGDFLNALAAQAKALREVVYDKMSPEGLAKASTHVMKALDELLRLSAFLEGQPDHRYAVEGKASFAGLTDEQLAQVSRWLDDNQQRSR